MILTNLLKRIKKAIRKTPKAMHRKKNRNKVKETNSNSLWVPCPICGSKTWTKVYADTVLIKFPLFCPKCRKETCIDVVKLKMVVSK